MNILYTNTSMCRDVGEAEEAEERRWGQWGGGGGGGGVRRGEGAGEQDFRPYVPTGTSKKKKKKKAKDTAGFFSSVDFCLFNIEFYYIYLFMYLFLLTLNCY